MRRRKPGEARREAKAGGRRSLEAGKLSQRRGDQNGGTLSGAWFKGGPVWVTWIKRKRLGRDAAVLLIKLTKITLMSTGIELASFIWPPRNEEAGHWKVSVYRKQGLDRTRSKIKECVGCCC